MIGNTLKQRREARGLDLREAADALKIRYDYLKALEDNTTDRLPDDVYARGHLRQYAQLLGVDLESLIESQTAPQTAQDAASDSQVRPQKATSRAPKMIAGITVIVFIGVALFRVVSTPTGRQEERLSTSKGMHQVEQAAPAAPAPTPIPSAPPLDQGATAPQEMGQRYTLNVKADETTWLRVDMGEGTSEEALLKPGEAKEWTSESGFDLKIGNAGGVRLALNGKDVGTLGKKGEVVRIKLPKEEFPAGEAGR